MGAPTCSKLGAPRPWYIQISYCFRFMSHSLSFGILHKTMIILKAPVELRNKNKMLHLTKKTANAFYAFTTTFFRVTSLTLSCNNRLFAAISTVLYLYTTVLLWPCGVMVTTLACDSRGYEFNSQPSRCQIPTFGKLFTHMCLCHQAV